MGMKVSFLLKYFPANCQTLHHSVTFPKKRGRFNGVIKSELKAEVLVHFTFRITLCTIFINSQEIGKL